MRNMKIAPNTGQNSRGTGSQPPARAHASTPAIASNAITRKRKLSGLRITANSIKPATISRLATAVLAERRRRPAKASPGKSV